MNTGRVKEKAKLRRQKLIELVESRGKVLLKEALAEVNAPNLSRQSLHDDLQAINDFGHQIKQIRDKKLTWLVDQKNAHWSTSDERSLDKQEEKQLVASFCTGMICGLDKIPDKLLSTGFRCHTKMEVQEALNQSRSLGSASEAASRVLRKLQAFWRELNRQVAIDAGTTTLETAKSLAKLKLPSPYNEMLTLAVCTNSRQIYETLGDPKVDIKTIIIGGNHVGRSNAIAGNLSIDFLNAAKSLHFAISFVGCSLIDVRELECNAPSWEESQLKACLFGKSTLKVVVADDSKISDFHLRSSFPFASLSEGSSHVDLIVTNRRSSNSDEAVNEDFDTMVQKIRENGVPVVVLEPSPRK